MLFVEDSNKPFLASPIAYMQPLCPILCPQNIIQTDTPLTHGIMPRALFSLPGCLRALKAVTEAETQKVIHTHWVSTCKHSKHTNTLSLAEARHLSPHNYVQFNLHSYGLTAGSHSSSEQTYAFTGLLGQFPPVFGGWGHGIQPAPLTPTCQDFLFISNAPMSTFSLLELQAFWPLCWSILFPGPGSPSLL